MSPAVHPQLPDQTTLKHLPTEQLVLLIVQQQTISQLQQEVNRLKASESVPDNNLAERSLRLAMTKRKIDGGSRSMARFAQTADLLSSSADLSPTLLRKVMKFFQLALIAKSGLGTSKPSHLPQPPT